MSSPGATAPSRASRARRSGRRGRPSDRPGLRLGQPGELRVPAQEPPERARARLDQRQPLLAFPALGKSGALPIIRCNLCGDRLDGRERVVDLVREHADDPLPRGLLLLAQRPAEVGQHDQLVRPAFAVERRATHLIAGRGARPNVRSTSRRASPTRYPRSRAARGRPAERLGPGLPSIRSAALLTKSSCSAGSNAKTATAISCITWVRSAVDSTASVRCRWSVAPRSLTSRMTIAMELPLRALNPRIE